MRGRGRDLGPSDPGSSSPSSGVPGGGKGRKRLFKDFSKMPRQLKDVIAALGKKSTETKIIQTGQGVPIILPSYGIGTGLARQQAKQEKPGITINMKQIQNEKNKRRTKTAKKATKSALTAARKRYTKLKKGVIKVIRAAKKKEYDDQNKKIKQLLPSQRKSARAKVKSQLKSKLDALLKTIRPASHYANTANVEAAVSKLRKYRW